jgi:hypothetical protein
MIRVETSLTEQDVATVTRIMRELEMTQAATLRLIIRRGVASIGTEAGGKVSVAEVRQARTEPLAATPAIPHRGVSSGSVPRKEVRLCTAGYCAGHGDGAQPDPCLRGTCTHGGTPWWK